MRSVITFAIVVLAIGAAQFIAVQLSGCSELPRGGRAAISFIATVIVLVIRGEGHKEIQ